MKKTSPKNIDEYIKMFSQDIQLKLEQLRQTIRKAAKIAEETINYQIPTFKLNGNLVHFAAFKTHIGFYPGASGILAFKNELLKYEVSKGTVRFSLNKPIPAALVKKIVKYRVKENLAKKK